MHTSAQIATHLRTVHFGGNWTDVCLKDKLTDVTWEQATRRVEGFHTIAELVFHTNYFVQATLKVLEGGPLDAKEAESFDHPPIASQHDWDNLLEQVWTDAEHLAAAIERLPDSRLGEPFVKAQYGTWYRCLHGPIEHLHYHLGQIAMMKALVADS